MPGSCHKAYCGEVAGGADSHGRGEPPLATVPRLAGLPMTLALLLSGTFRVRLEVTGVGQGY